jgi:hypothetical protein
LPGDRCHLKLSFLGQLSDMYLRIACLPGSGPRSGHTYNCNGTSDRRL